jgi:hypothetical protein
MVINSGRCTTLWIPLMAVISTALIILAVVSTVSAQPGMPIASRLITEATTTLPPPWLEFGPDGRLIARVIVDGDCPALAVDGFDVPMSRRAPASGAFPVVTCEATVPFGTETASILDQDLPLPGGPIRRIAVIGDTGCRLNDWEKKYQACNDPDAWPFAQVARAVADWNPDLIVHVGDYLYRESPCPEGMAGCEGNPYGDNWATWDADFFTPAASVLGAAPWVFMRGNHAIAIRSAGLPSLTRASTSQRVSRLPSPT